MTSTTPKDHKPKADAPRTVEVQGLSLRIDEAALDDFELLDDLNTVGSGKTEATLVVPRVLRSFLGSDQYRLVMDHLRDPHTGRVGIEAAGGFFADLLAALNPN